MKTIKLLTAICCLAFITMQCATESNDVDKTKTKSDNMTEMVDAVINPQDTISKDTFMSWINNWKNHGAAYMNTTVLRFFTMNKVDLTQVLAEPGVAKTRFYLGLDMSVTPNVPHLIVVGVNSSGDDMLDYAQGQYAYDVTKPCPIFCQGGQK